jgi:hypothetical protein
MDGSKAPPKHLRRHFTQLTTLTSKKHKKTWLLNQLKCASSKRPAPANTRCEFMHRLLSFFLSACLSLSLSRKRTRAPMRLDKCSLSLSRRLFDHLRCDFFFFFDEDDDDEEPKPASKRRERKHEPSLLFFFRETARVVVLFSGHTRREEEKDFFSPREETPLKKRPAKVVHSRSPLKEIQNRASSCLSSRREGESFGTRRLSRSGEIESSERAA